MDVLESQLEQLIKQQQAALPPVAPLKAPPAPFSEPHNDFEMSSNILKISNANIIIVGIGVLLSSTVGGYLTRFLPSTGKYAPILAGLAIMWLGKRNSMVKDLGAGILLGGVGSAFAGFASGLGLSENMPMQEDKVTYGGTDGVYPTQPDRRVFA